MKRVDTACTFCNIVRGSAPASMVCEDAISVAFMDLRQFHGGHVLVVPRRHLDDVRGLEAAEGASVMAMVSRVARAVGATFPNQGLSVWHSIGEAAGQEVPHCHFHVHPRLPSDGMLRIYPHPPRTPDKRTRESYATMVRSQLEA